MGLIFAASVHPPAAGTIGLVLLVVRQMDTVGALLDRNRDDIWVEQRDPRAANLQLARSLLVLFFGVLCAYALAVLLLDADRLEEWFGPQLGAYAHGPLTDVDFGAARDLLAHNGRVMAIAFFFALVYREGGLLFVLGWNASRWGILFSYAALMAHQEGAGSVMGHVVRTMICVLPHLVLEVVAYVLVAMAGVFLHKALRRYQLTSARFARVGRAVLVLVAIAAVALGAAAVAESRLAPWLVDRLF